MSRAFRPAAPLFALALAGALSACSGTTPDDTNGDQTPDAGASAPVCATTKATRHASYVPAAEKPTDAKRIIVLGDSISTGTGASTPGLSYFGLLGKNDAAWTAELKTSFSARYGHDVDLVNVAVNGATTGSMAQHQLDALGAALGGPAAGHSIVVLTIGGNDLQSAITDAFLGGTDDALANLRTTVTYLQDKAKFPDGTSIYLATVYDPSDGEGHAQGCFLNQTLPTFVTALDTWRTKYIALGTELGFSVVDSLGHFHGHGHNFDHTANPYYQASDATGWFSDCVHPNDRGHDELRRLFFEAVDCSYVATP
jgi:lysophospholipase L1-like esterase